MYIHSPKGFRMAIKRAIEGNGGTFTPAELALLEHVFINTSVTGESDTERQNRASRIIATYQAGIRDKDELTSLCRKPLGR